MFEVVLFFWLFGALIGLSAARAKGLGTAAGLIGGILLGPLAILMFLCSNGKKRCPYCQEWIENRATVCPYCAQFTNQNPEQKKLQIKTENTQKTVSIPNVQNRSVDTPTFQEDKLTDRADVSMAKIILSKQIRNDKNENINLFCPSCGQKISIESSDIINGYENFCCPECRIILIVKTDGDSL